MERFWRATFIVTRAFGAATRLIFAAFLDEILPMLVRPHAAKVLTSFADLNLLRWLYPAWKRTPAAFSVRVLELPPPFAVRVGRRRLRRVCTAIEPVLRGRDVRIVG
jgi:hypothetical protein